MSENKDTDSVEKSEIVKEVINSINQYTDEDVDGGTSYDDCAKIRLTKDLGIGPMMITQLSIPLSKISKAHAGYGVGVYDIQKAKTVKDCIDLVIKSLK